MFGTTQEAICFECGYRYFPKSARVCPRCGEVKVFVPALHDQNYDISKDPVELLKMRVIGIGVALVTLIAVVSLR